MPCSYTLPDGLTFTKPGFKTYLMNGGLEELFPTAKFNFSEGLLSGQKLEYYRRANVNPKIDTLLVAIAKLGGIARKNAKAEGIDPEAFNKKFNLLSGGLNRMLFTDKGEAYSGMRESLIELGYPVTAIDNDFVKLVSESVNQGTKIYSEQGEDAMLAEYDEKHNPANVPDIYAKDNDVDNLEYSKTPDLESGLGISETIPSAYKTDETEEDDIPFSRVEPLTHTFREWFKDSKMRADGIPIEFYHGTDKDFTEFKDSVLGEATMHPTAKLGHFFTRTKDVAKGYGPKVMSVYLSIQKPFVTDSLRLDQGIEKFGSPELFKKHLIASGYDGIYIKDAQYAIIFDSWQAKDVTNKYPSANDPDIHFKRGEGSQAQSYTKADAIQHSVGIFGQGINRLVNQGILKFTAGKAFWPEEVRAKLRGGEEAVYHRGTAYIDITATPKSRLGAVILHELGEHYGLKKMIGDVGYRNLINQITNRAKIEGSAAQREWNRVAQLYPDLKVGSDHFVSEVIAKLGEKNPQAPWYRRLLSQIKAFLVRVGLGKGFLTGTMTDADIHDLLKASLDSVIATAGGPRFYGLGDTVAAAKTELKAPNGKPSNLNAKQWAQVRTPEFKAWFGDWEQTFQKGVLITELTGDEIKGLTPTEARKDAKRFIDVLIKELVDATGKDTLLNTRTGLDIRLTTKGVVHGFQHRGVQNVKASAGIKSLIESAAKIAELPHVPTNDNFKSVLTFVTPLKLGDEMFTVKLTVKQSWDGKARLYDHQAIKMPDGISESTPDKSGSIHRPASGLELSIEQMLSAFKGDNSKYLSSKVVDENGEPRIVWHSTDKEFTVFKKGAEGIWFADDRQESMIAADVGDNPISMGVYLNIKTPNYSQEYLTKETVKSLEDAKFDGVILPSVGGVGNDYVAFNPNQIKSATDNSGQFSSENDDIYFSRVSDIADEYKENIIHTLDKQKDNVITHKLAFLTVRQIAKYAKNFLPILSDYVNGMQNRRATIDTILRATQPTLEAWRKLLKPVKKSLDSLMQDSTLSDVDVSRAWSGVEKIGGVWTGYTQSNFDKKGRGLLAEKAKALGSTEHKRGFVMFPSEQNAKEYVSFANSIEVVHGINMARKDNHTDLVTRFKAMTPEAQKIYVDANKQHTELFDRRLKAIEDRIAEDVLDSNLRRQMIDELRKEFETKSLSWYYAPLGRFGTHWFYGTDKNGQKVFRTFESEASRDAALKTFEGVEIGHGTNIENLEVINPADSEFVNKITDMILQSKKIDNNVKTELRDEIYQVMLASLPSVSVRHSSQHRAGTLGFDEDQMRSYAHNMHHGASQYANMVYGRNMLDVLKDAKAIIKLAETPSLRAKEEVKRDAAQDLLDNLDNLDTFLADIAKEPASEHKSAVEALVEKFGHLDSMEGSLEKVIARSNKLISNSKLLTPDTLRKASDAVSELNRSYQAMVAYNTSAMDVAAQWVRQLGFVYMLGFGVSSGLVNMLQTPGVALPIAAGKHGYAKSAKYFGRTLSEFTKAVQMGYAGDVDADGNYSITQVLEAHKAALEARNQDTSEVEAELAFLNEIKNAGDISRTQVFDHAGVGSAGENYGGALQELSKNMGWMFHHGERANREMTLLAAYRLERDDLLSKNPSADPAVIRKMATEYARDLNNDAHGDYASENAARLLRGWPAGIAFQFKKYPQMMMWLWGTTVAGALKHWRTNWDQMPDSPEKTKAMEEARQAASRLGAMFLTQTAFAGALGLPLTGAAMATLNVFGFFLKGDDDEPWDTEREIRSTLTDWFGETGATLITKGVFNAATPVNVADRLSMKDLIFREPLVELEGRDAATNYLAGLTGPAGGILQRLFQGVKFWSDGEIGRGFEQILPKSMGDIVKAGRFANEEALSLDKQKVKDMSAVENMFQMIGFSSSNLELKFAERGYIKAAEKANKDARESIQFRAAHAKIDGKPIPREEIIAWNKRHPEYKITTDTIHKSIRGILKHKKEREGRGFEVDPKFAYLYEKYNVTD